MRGELYSPVIIIYEAKINLGLNYGGNNIGEL